MQAQGKGGEGDSEEEDEYTYDYDDEDGPAKRVAGQPPDRVLWPLTDSRVGKEGREEHPDKLVEEKLWARKMRIRKVNKAERATMGAGWWCPYCQVTVGYGRLIYHWERDQMHRRRRKAMTWYLRMNHHMREGRLRAVGWKEPPPSGRRGEELDMRLWCRTCSKEITRDHLISKEHIKRDGWPAELMPADFDDWDSDWEKSVEEESVEKWKEARCARWRRCEKPALVEQLPRNKEMLEMTKEAVEDLSSEELKVFIEAGGMEVIS